MDGLAIFSRRILPTFSYTFADDHDRPLDTGECCVGYSKDEFGNCIEGGLDITATHSQCGANIPI